MSETDPTLEDSPTSSSYFSQNGFSENGHSAEDLKVERTLKEGRIRGEAMAKLAIFKGEQPGTYLSVDKVRRDDYGRLQRIRELANSKGVEYYFCDLRNEIGMALDSHILIAARTDQFREFSTDVRKIMSNPSPRATQHGFDVTIILMPESSFSLHS